MNLVTKQTVIGHTRGENPQYYTIQNGDEFNSFNTKWYRIVIPNAEKERKYRLKRGY